LERVPIGNRSEHPGEPDSSSNSLTSPRHRKLFFQFRIPSELPRSPLIRASKSLTRVTKGRPANCRKEQEKGGKSNKARWNAHLRWWNANKCNSLASPIRSPGTSAKAPPPARSFGGHGLRTRRPWADGPRPRLFLPS